MFKYDSTLIAADNPIGNGPQSCVYPYLDDANEGQWVVKCLNVTHSEELNMILRNIFLSSSSNHPGLVPVKDYDVQKDQDGHSSIYIKMPRIKESLQDIIRYYQASEEKMIPLEKIVGYLYCIATSLDELAQKRTAHRNIKPTNILIDAEGSVFLSDLKMHQTAEGIKSSSDDSHYRAPEVNQEGWVLNEEALYKADAWSLGMVITEACLIDTFKPISSNLSVQEKREILEENLAEIRRKYSKDLADIIRGLLTINAKDREDFGAVSKLLEKRFPDIVRNWGKENEEESLALIQRNDLEGKKHLAPMDLEDALLGSKNVPRLTAMKKWMLSHKLLLLVILVAIILAGTLASIFIPRHIASVAALKKEKYAILMQKIKMKMEETKYFKMNFDASGTVRIDTLAPVDDPTTREQKFLEDILIAFVNDLVVQLEAEDVIDQVQGLFISFKRLNHITDFGFDTLALRIAHFNSLEGFLIWNGVGTKLSVMKFISTMSSNFPNLGAFGLPFPGDEHDLSEYTILKAFPHLKALFVIFADMNKEELSLFMSQVSKQGKSLVKLEISFMKNVIYDDSVLDIFNTELFSGLKNCTNLTRLSLDYSQTSLTSEGWDKVATALSLNGHNLKWFEILFNVEAHYNYYGRPSWSFNESILTTFAHTLAQEKLNNLTDLVLATTPVSITEETRHIVEQELNYIPNIKIFPKL